MENESRLWTAVGSNRCNRIRQAVARVLPECESQVLKSVITYP